MPKYLIANDVGGSTNYMLIEAENQEKADEENWERFLEDVQSYWSCWTEDATPEAIEEAKNHHFDDYTSAE